MKILIPINSKDKNPTDKFKGNPVISNDYLVLIDGIYGRGQYSHINKNWLVIETFFAKLDEDLFGDKYNMAKERRNNRKVIHNNVIWFKSVTLTKKQIDTLIKEKII